MERANGKIGGRISGRIGGRISERIGGSIGGRISRRIGRRIGGRRGGGVGRRIVGGRVGWRVVYRVPNYQRLPIPLQNISKNDIEEWEVDDEQDKAWMNASMTNDSDLDLRELNHSSSKSEESNSVTRV